MAGSLNKACLIGNVGKDPEVRSMQDGRKIVNLSIATSESWKDKQSGERKERTEWHRVVIFNEGIAGIAERFVKKGTKLYIEGSIRTRKWTDQSGVERYSTEICLEAFGGTLQLLSSPDGEGRVSAQSSGGAPAGGSSAGHDRAASARRADAQVKDTYGGGGSDLDDEIPFGPEWR
jgi:single-strand DNA-binding protein